MPHLTLRALNRATLARQLLLDRVDQSVPATIEHLLGLQAQVPLAPYVGLWTRLRNFRREDLAALINAHSIVKATLMRAPLHLFTADDYLRLRATLQPVLDRSLKSIVKQQPLDFDRILAAATEFLAEAPRTFAELSAMLAELEPGADVGAMRYAVRMRLPLVQVPIATGWSYPGNPKFALAERWIGQPISADDQLRDLFFRYLAAFGPATISDFQTWSGLPSVKAAVEKWKPDLCLYRDEQGRELLDLPGMPLPDPDTPVPVRLLPEFDNLILGHNLRTRVIDEQHRVYVFLSGLRVSATFLIDGFVRGTWKIEKTKKTAALVFTTPNPLTQPEQDALFEEGERLLRFVESDAAHYEIRVAD